MEAIKGWAIDLKSVYGRFWKDRQKFHLSEDLWESPDGGTAALLYGIAEVGISKEVGRLAVFHCKEKPEPVLNLPKLLCWYLYDSAVQFGEDGLLFVHQFIFGKKVFGIKLLALDISANRFAVISQLPKDFYEIRHIEAMEYGFKKMSESSSPEIPMDLKGVEWKALGNKFNFWFTLPAILRFFSWAFPLLVTAAYAYIIYLFAQIPIKGDVDLVLPDGPLSNETNFGPIWHSLALPAPVFGAYILWLWRVAKTKVLASGKAYWLILWALALLMLSPLVYMGLNSILDRSQPQIYKVGVVDKYESTDINTAANTVWRLTLSSWRPGRAIEILPVTKEEYDRVDPRRSQVVLGIKPGRFGYAWIESYAIVLNRDGAKE